MADLRLIALLAAAGCGRASAADAIAPPPGWVATPLLAEAARAALGKDAVIERLDAWGEPAMGCYAIAVAMRAVGSPATIAEQVIAGFGIVGAEGTAPGTIAISDVVRPAAEAEAGVLALAFQRGEHRGRLRARLGGDQLAAIACFANAREPASCQPACQALLAKVGP